MAIVVDGSIDEYIRYLRKAFQITEKCEAQKHCDISCQHGRSEHSSEKVKYFGRNAILMSNTIETKSVCRFRLSGF